MNAPLCPVCGMTLQATAVNPNMYYCTKRRVWVSDLGDHLDTVDAAIYVAPDGRQTMKVIEIPPYIFSITDDGNVQKTVVKKLMPPDGLPWKKLRLLGPERKIILTGPAVMTMPWNDKEKVVKKLHLYMLFS